MPLYRHFFRTKSESGAGHRRMIHGRESIAPSGERTVAGWLRWLKMRESREGVKIRQMRDRLCFFC